MSYAQLQADETIAVVGAGGGVGGAVVQIAKVRGCRVIAIDRKAPDPNSPAGRLIDDYVAADSDIPAEVRKLTKGAGASVVFDSVGGVMFEPALRSLAHHGRLVGSAARANAVSSLTSLNSITTNGASSALIVESWISADRPRCWPV
jgi:NADPH:quinone reductase-like Zn-dependent oxidoreductase